MTSQSVITLLKRALNLLDYRIIDHGQRVLYIVFKMLKRDGIYSGHELHKICFLCALHDIGAYKTEQLDTLGSYRDAMKFETWDTIKHSAYGYLFLRNFSILEPVSDAILFHHFRYDELQKSGCNNKDLAAKLYVAERVDLFLQLGKLKIDDNLFCEYRDTVFSAHDLDLIMEIEKEEQLGEKLLSGEYLQELDLLYPQAIFDERELLSFLKTLSYLIDFRSEYTVLHTISTVHFSVEIAKRMGLSEGECQKIYYGALLHDVGKISTPTSVLEKCEKLDDFEYSIIKDHVVMSELILKGCVDDDILQIAIRHHEKLDGSGYHKGLCDKDLTLSQKIVCVADILSALYGKRSYKEPFPREKIFAIITDMAERGQISKEVVAVVVAEYTAIVENVERSCEKVTQKYKQMNEQYHLLCQNFKAL